MALMRSCRYSKKCWVSCARRTPASDCRDTRLRHTRLRLSTHSLLLLLLLPLLLTAGTRTSQSSSGAVRNS